MDSPGRCDWTAARQLALGNAGRSANPLRFGGAWAWKTGRKGADPVDMQVVVLLDCLYVKAVSSSVGPGVVVWRALEEFITRM